MRADVRAEIVGVLVGVSVAPGDEVVAGAEVATLESMKMEIPVEAHTAGRVREIRAKVGDVVQEGQTLIVLETMGSD